MISLTGSGISKPHGGKLVNRITTKDPNQLFSISINADLANDVENIADGIFSPLEGFVMQEDFENIVSRGRLANDLPWTVPIVLDADKDTATKMKDARDVALNVNGMNFAILHVDDVYTFDKNTVASKIYGTSDIKHPGVAKTMNMKEFLVGGKIDYVKRPDETQIRRYRKTPTQTREFFQKAGWKTIVAFQTRNVPHVAHEMLQKASLNTHDGLFVNPLIGKKKSGDYKDEVIVAAYESLMQNYYPQNRCYLGTLHTEMRYAGPKEAIHHSIMRKNFGCTNIIIGRDHAGVGTYYDPFASQKIFDQYPDIGIEPIFFPAFFYCRKCLSFASERNCPHGAEYQESLSGTKLRAMILDKQNPSEYMMRPEVFQVLAKSNNPFVD
ncbi:Sulfate adenylyltransferase [Nitrosotalea sinensis]|uniref:Sulfate adenylyltransferase n=1 Tax=Nitrosotalea sinensis TaxID=1499975 RepID=A0A2H1EF38_9ARCH|nr:Sulfate adenylyltransferase [Candidatus Nitrosotalea sinensis]